MAFKYATVAFTSTRVANSLHKHKNTNTAKTKSHETTPKPKPVKPVKPRNNGNKGERGQFWMKLLSGGLFVRGLVAEEWDWLRGFSLGMMDMRVGGVLRWDLSLSLGGGVGNLALRCQGLG